MIKGYKIKNIAFGAYEDATRMARGREDVPVESIDASNCGKFIEGEGGFKSLDKPNDINVVPKNKVSQLVSAPPSAKAPDIPKQ